MQESDTPRSLSENYRGKALNMAKRQLDRISKLLRLLTNTYSRPISLATLQERLEASASTIKHDIQFMRDSLDVPITYDQQKNGYYIQSYPGNRSAGNLVPGLWISGEEAYALLTLFNVLKKIDPGVLGSLVRPLTPVLKKIMSDSQIRGYGFDRKIDVDLAFKPENDGRALSAISYALANDQYVSIKFKEGTELRSGNYLPTRLTLKPKGWVLTAEAMHREEQAIEVPMNQLAECAIIEEADIENRPPPFPVW